MIFKDFIIWGGHISLDSRINNLMEAMDLLPRKKKAHNLLIISCVNEPTDIHCLLQIKHQM